MKKNQPPIDHQETIGMLLDIPIEQIRPYAQQPRTEFDEEEMRGLCNSIREFGQQTPIQVRPILDGACKYEIIDGERRWRACKLINSPTIKAHVWHVQSDDDQFLQSTVANFCRSGHTPLETARAIEKIMNHLLKKSGRSKVSKRQIIEKIAAICGHSAPWVFQHLSLLKLCPDVKEFITEKELPFQVGVALTHLKPKYQVSFAKYIIRHELNFKQALHYIRVHRKKGKLAKGARMRQPSRDYAILKRFIAYLKQDVDNLLDLPIENYAAMFNGPLDGKLVNAISSLQVSSDKLQELIKLLKRVQKRKETLKNTLAQSG